MITFADNSLLQVHPVPGKGKVHVRAHCKGKSVKTLIPFITAHLCQNTGGRVGREEQPLPTAGGTHLQVVSTLDGTVTYVRLNPKDIPLGRPTLRDRRHAHNGLQARVRRFKGSQDEACGEGCNGIHVSAKIQSVRPKPSEWVPEECDKGNQIGKHSGGTTLQVQITCSTTQLSTLGH